MRTTFRLLALLLTFGLTTSILQAQVDDPKDSFRALRTLDGVWFMPTDRGDRLEIWKIADDSTLTGRGVRIKPENGDTVTLETMRITLRDTLVVYSVTVRGQNSNKAIDFKLTRDDAEGFRFENPKHDDPQVIRYLLLSNRELQVTTETRKNNRTITEEYVFEREFNPASTEFRVRVGVGASALQSERDFNGITPEPTFGWKPDWDLAFQTSFKGRGGFLTLNVELGLAGRYSGVNAAFDVVEDTTFTHYVRNGTYRSTWVQAAVYPEFTLRRDGRLAVIVGPYFGRLLTLRATGDVSPESDTKLVKSNNDWKKNDFGLLAGLQYRLPAKKDRGAKVGFRFNYGLTNVDNLFHRRCVLNPALCNERLLLRSAQLYYSVNLLKL